MASGPEQLMDDYKQVQKLLETYPNIKITHTEGDPPEKYDIEYTIKGYKIGPDGNAVPDNKHEVSITLPFGYPHFPPTAKPITPIFHPDIDPDAIRIADFWQENHSLPELIIHIGQMICGNHYTKDEPFNQSAFEWFEERKTWLPFDILEPRDEEDVAEEVATEAEDAPPTSDEIEQALAQSVDLDILKDDIDFPFEEDEAIEDLEEEIALDIGKTDASDDLSTLEEEEPSEEFSLDFDGEEQSAEPFDLQETEEDAIDDLFSLEPEEDSDELSFDLTDIEDEIEAIAEEPATDDLFQLETEEPPEELQEEIPLEFDSEDFSSAFEQEESNETAEPVADVTLDDLAGLDEEEGALDFDISEESFDLEGEETADLSGLEEEVVADLTALEEEPVEITTDAETAEVEETADDEDKILAALSLDEDLSSPGKAEEQSEIIRSLIDQKQIFSAKKVLADLVEPEALSDKQELELTISGAVSEAEDLYKKADQHEKKGEFEKAGIFLDLIANIAADFPGLEMARNRIRESIMGESKKKPGETEEKKEEVAKEEKAPAEKPDSKKKKAPSKLRIKIPAKVLIIVLFVLILGGIGTGLAYVYNNDIRIVKLAGSSFQKAEQLVNRKEFKQAQKQLNTARASLEGILLFQKGEKEAISRKINGLSNSNVLKEGLKGRVLYGDQYYTVEVAKAIDKFNTHKSYAEQVLKSGKYEAAIAAYEKSLPYAEKAEFTDQVTSVAS